MKHTLAVMAILLPILAACQTLSLQGKVLSATGTPLEGATITLLRTGAATTAGAEGAFSLSPVLISDSILVEAIGYQSQRLPANQRGTLVVYLTPRVALLDEAIVIAYGRTTRRFNTGNVSRLSAKDLGAQPVSNALAALEGRIPGLTVVQSSGLPGASLSLQLRGQSSLTQGAEPLFIIDGVPFAPGNTNTNRLGSLLSGNGAGLSPFNAINPADIESIEVLKDADATAIYGSRGANGVVLITTKKGRTGKTSVTARYASGWGRATVTPQMLNTSQYLALRREAFANDGVLPTAAGAPDLLVWDTTRYTNFSQLLLGGTARTADAGLEISGGSEGTSFSGTVNWRRETTILPGNLHNNKFSSSLSLGHASANKRFTADFSTNFSNDDNRLAGAGSASFLSLPPNAPALYTAAGALNWEEGGQSFSNPLAYLERPYKARTVSLLTNATLSYKIFPGLQLKTSAGYNRLAVDEQSLTPMAAQNPATSPKGLAQFANSSFSGWIAEPQATYDRQLGKGRMQLLAGASIQQNKNEGLSIGASGYSSDALLASLAAAPAVSFRNNSLAEYRYAAAFGRINYNWREKLIINLSGRRDGSSRFGPGRQFAHFGAAGAAWIFSTEKFIREKLPVLSFGKLRASLGTAGNDQIGDYKYLDAWNVTSAYGGNTALYPASAINPNYGWELVKKQELALELGFWKNRLLLSLSAYRHRSQNQLVELVLPSQTGFFSTTDNFPALVQNQGLEFELTSLNRATANFKWTTSANFSIPRNQLLSFPGLATSAYSATYKEGYPLSVINKLHLTGIDPLTGVYTFEDVSKDGAITIPADYTPQGQLAPDFFGGLGNTLSFKGWEAQVFFVFKKQLGTSYLGSIYNTGTIPGAMANLPVDFLNRWQAPQTGAQHQKLSAATSGAVASAAAKFRSSDGLFSDASFLRLKTLALTYNLPQPVLQKLKARSLKIYFQAQNLFTFTRFKGADPETQSLFGIPPLRVINTGIQITF